MGSIATQRREARRKKRLASDPEYRRQFYRNKRLRHTHQMSLADYTALLQAQQGKCAICGAAHVTRPGYHLNVDHDHQTGYVRGLLCHTCNMGIGMFGDSPERLRRAADYLTNGL